MKSEENVTFRAHRLLAESTELGRQCAEFYERQNEAEPSLGELTGDVAVLGREEALS
jgi:hypothetical protein